MGRGKNPLQAETIKRWQKVFQLVCNNEDWMYIMLRNFENRKKKKWLRLGKKNNMFQSDIQIWVHSVQNSTLNR